MDLEYPEELHNSHNDFPSGSGAHGDSKGVDVGVSPRRPRRRGGANRGPKAGPQPPQQRSLCSSLQELAALPVTRHEAEKVHRALAFEQSPWMEPYIRMNTELRKKATIDFETNLYKMMNNSVFRKNKDFGVESPR